MISRTLAGPSGRWAIVLTGLLCAAVALLVQHCGEDAPSQPLWTLAAPADSVPLPGPFRVVGFWMAPTRGYRWDSENDTYTPMCAAWRAAGANGIMLNCPDLESAHRNLERTGGYTLRFLGGPGLRRVYEWDALLRDAAVNQGFAGLYLDDGWFAWLYDRGAGTPWTPFDAGQWRAGLDSLFLLAETYDKDVGVNVYEIEGIRRIIDLARDFDARHPGANREHRLIIYTGARYFDNGPRFLEYSDAVRAYAGRADIPLSRLQPWIAPSCATPHADGVYTAPGCSADWTLTLILRLAELRFGGVHVYLANGFDAQHRDRLLLALWATGNLHLPAHARPSTYGEFRSILSDTLLLRPILDAARACGIPTHLPDWEWVK